MTRYDDEIMKSTVLISSSTLRRQLREARHSHWLSFKDHGLTTIPMETFSIIDLRQLYLACNQLTELPIKMNVFLQLEKLDLFKNRLVDFPVSMCLSLNSLTYLRLAFNKLTSLPAEFGGLDNLRQLDVSNNRLISLPDELVLLKKLRHLDLSFNLLCYVNGLILEGIGEELETFNLSHNSLEVLPDEISCAAGLRELHLENNNLHALPRSLVNLNRLTALSISGNVGLEDVCLNYSGVKQILMWLRRAPSYVVHPECLLDSDNSTITVDDTIQSVNSDSAVNTTYNFMKKKNKNENKNNKSNNSGDCNK